MTTLVETFSNSLVTQLKERVAAAKVDLRHTRYPAAYCRERLHFNPWKGQRDILNAVRDAFTGAKANRIAVHSANSVGKTSISACVALWAYDLLRAVVVTTAPTGRQVRELLWKEIHNRKLHATPRLPGRILNVKAHRSPKNWMLGFSTDEQQNIQGFHADRLLIIVDEANGFPEDLFEAIQGNITGEASVLLMIGNPLVPSGTFFEACQVTDGTVQVVHLDGLDHPNVRRGREIIKGAITKKWADDRRMKWGEKSTLYQARVRGKFPDHALDSFWTPADVKRMLARIPERVCGPNVLSIDCARFGDDQASLDHMIGSTLIQRKNLPQSSTNDIVRVATGMDVNDQIELYVVDDCLGSGVVDKLREMGKPVHAFNGGESAYGGSDDDVRFANCRAEAYWLAAQVSERVSLLADSVDAADWMQQLPAVRYGFTPKGAIQVEKKEQIKKRINRSPDDADALVMNLWAQIRLCTGVRRRNDE